jgi:hypothetical protein
MRHYDSAEVLTHCDVTRNQLARWCDAGIIQTSGGGSPGKRREFTFRNLVEVAVCADLHALGVTEAQMRGTVRDLSAIWDQPDGPIDSSRADKPTHRDMTILWLALHRADTLIEVDGIARREFVAAMPADATFLVNRLTTGDGESGIAIPIARIIADLERRTGDVFDAEANLRKQIAEALRVAMSKDPDHD